MNAQDRTVVKNLLQYMTNKQLVGSEEFRAAMEHFNITTTYCWENARAEKSHVVDVYAPDMECDFDRHAFATQHAAQVFAECATAQGDDE